VPLHPMAAKHDPQALIDPQVNCLAAVRFGHADLTIGRGGSWHCGTAACKSGQCCDSNHQSRRGHTPLTHITVTCRVGGRFREGAPFDKVVSRISEPSQLRVTEIRSFNPIAFRAL